MEGRPLVYVETSVISYYTSRPSNDVVALARQKMTHRWWKRAVERYEMCISEIVINEISAGDKAAAFVRLSVIKGFRRLTEHAEERLLAAKYLQRINLPSNAVYDAYHISAATIARADFLVSWNCKHIANAQIRRSITEINESQGLPTPVICTPEALLHDLPK